MVAQGSLLLSLMHRVDRMPLPTSSCARRRRGRPVVYSPRLFLKALVVMVVRRLHTPHEVWAVLQEPTREMRRLRRRLCPAERFPCRRTWERRLATLPATLPAQIGALGRLLVQHLQPFARAGRAAAIDSTLLRAYGGHVWHVRHQKTGYVPHSGIDCEAGWSKSGHHGWVYGWKVHLVVTTGEMWIPLAAQLTPANTSDNHAALPLLPEVPPEVRFVLGDTHYNAPNVREECALRGQVLVAPQHARSKKRADPGCSKEVRRLFHALRSCTIETFNQHFKCLFDVHRPVPTKGYSNTACHVLGAVLTYQLLLWQRWSDHLPLRQGLKHALKAA